MAPSDTWRGLPPASDNSETDRHRQGKGRRRKEKKQELDSRRLEQRIKQVTYGENTRGYVNLMKALEREPNLAKGCIPLRPAVHQKCSKRSWDGQIRKWRRSLHMYDYVDFGESEAQSAEVRAALVEQTLNPAFSVTPAKGPAGDRTPAFDLFSPMRGTTWAEEFDSPFAPSPAPPQQSVLGPSISPLYTVSPIRFSVTKAAPDHLEPPRRPPMHRRDSLGPVVTRVRYTFDQLYQLFESPLVAAMEVRLPDALGWLDKRVDLEDDIEDEGDYAPKLDPRTPVNQRFLCTPSEYAPITPRRAVQTLPPDATVEGLTPGPIGSPTRVAFQRPRVDNRPSPFHPGARMDLTPPRQERPTRRASIGGVLPDLRDAPSSISPVRTPFKQITRSTALRGTAAPPLGKASTAPRRRPILMTAEALEADKENLPPSLLWTPPRRPCDPTDAELDMYCRMAGFM